MQPPDRIYLQTEQERDWTCSENVINVDDTEYIRADLHPTHAQQAVCEAVLHLYSPTGTWLGDEMRESGVDPFPRLWRLVQLVTHAPKPTGTRWAPHEGLLRELVCALTGASMDEVTEPLSELLHSLRYPVHEAPGMVVTELEAWEYEGEDGG